MNYVVYDKDWEAGFTERLEKLDDIVVSYVKNHSLLFEVPYEYGGETYRYRPDFIVRLGNERRRAPQSGGRGERPARSKGCC